MSFTDLVRDRYESKNQPHSAHSDVFIFVLSMQVKSAPQLAELELVSLKRSFLKLAGSPGQISSTCPLVKQLDISATLIEDFGEILQIVRELRVFFTQFLQFMDLSYLQLDLNSFVETEETFPSVNCVAFEGCRLTNRELSVVSKMFPNIEKLIIQGTGEPVCQLFTTEFSMLKELDLSFCNISEFSQIQGLAMLRLLRELKLCNNPISELLPIENGFESLKQINLEHTAVRSLKSIHHLNSMPAVTEVRLTNTPLFSRFGKNLRLLAMCYIPKLLELNGSNVTERERCSQERQFVRQFSHPQLPEAHLDAEDAEAESLVHSLIQEEIQVNTEVYLRLYAKHGTVLKFANVRLQRPIKAQIVLKLDTDENSSVSIKVPLGWNVGDLKDLVIKKFGIPRNDLRLFHGDPKTLSMFGFQLLRFSETDLITINLKDGDIILVSKKSLEDLVQIQS